MCSSDLLERVIVDSTVQSKAIAHPVDSRLLEITRHKVVSAAKRVPAARPAQQLSGHDLLGPFAQEFGGGLSPAGRLLSRKLFPRVPVT